MTSTSIDCGTCEMANTDHCNGCLVSFILDREPDDAVIIDAAEARAMCMLSRAGLLPEVKHKHRVG